MKKILSLVLVAAFSISAAIAQTPAAKKAKIKATTDKKVADVKPAAEAKPSVAKTGPVKKDGTPDKRFKANKTATDKPVTGPTKKDGTPDMRYKANKDAAAKKQ